MLSKLHNGETPIEVVQVTSKISDSFALGTTRDAEAEVEAEEEAEAEAEAGGCGSFLYPAYSWKYPAYPAYPKVPKSTQKYPKVPLITLKL